MTDDTVYKSPIVDINPIPDGDIVNEATKASGSVYVPESSTEQENSLPKSSVIAVEVLSKALDTSKKKILGEFSFGQLGAIKIGAYSAGESGEVAISPSGIIATNSSGETTFALDGETGDATFKGTIQAGAFIAGAVEVGGGNVQIDGANKRIIINDGTNDRILIGYQVSGF